MRGGPGVGEDEAGEKGEVGRDSPAAHLAAHEQAESGRAGFGRVTLRGCSNESTIVEYFNQQKKMELYIM